MTQELAKTKGGELLNRVISFSPEEDATIDLELRRLTKEAENLLENDAFNGYLILGILGTLQHNSKMMRENHLKALRISQNDVLALGNFAVSLHRLGFFEDACEYIKKANDQYAGSDVETVGKMAMFSLDAGRLNDALIALKQWRKLKSEEYKIEALLVKVEEYVASLDEDSRNSLYEYSPILIKESLNLLKERDINNIQCTAGVSSDDSSTWMSWVLKLALPIDEIVDLNFNLADRLAEKNLLGNSNSVVLFT